MEGFYLLENVLPGVPKGRGHLNQTWVWGPFDWVRASELERDVLESASGHSRVSW